MTVLSSIVNPVITSESRGITRKSFGEVLVCGKHDAWGERYRVYDAGPALQNIVADGISADSPIYDTVRSIVSQSPKVQKVIVGRLVTSFSQDIDLIVQATVTEGDIYAFTLQAPNGGAATAISYTAQAGDTPTLVATAIAALIGAVSGITATSLLEVISCVADNADEMWGFEGLDVQQIWFKDNTADTLLATEIAEIEALYPGWYGMALADCESVARMTAVAAYVETLEKVYFATSFDTENADSGSTSSATYMLKAAGYNRTIVCVSNDQAARFGAGYMGARFPLDPGSQTWAYKDVNGVTVDTWTATQQNAIEASNGNTLTTLAGLRAITPAKTVGGEWIDAIRGRDWFLAEIRERVFTLLANAPKVPFTDGGIAAVKKEIRAAQTAGVAAGYLVAEPAPFVTVPLAADVSSADKIARVLPDIYFEQTLAGAIHFVTPITGVLKV